MGRTAYTRSCAAAPLLVVILAASSAASAGARTARKHSPPRHALIHEGRSAGGVTLGQRAIPRGSGVAGAGVGGWGPVAGFCLEGTSCGWSVPGGGRAQVDLDRGRVVELRTSAAGWHTPRGVRPGTSVQRLRHVYGRRVHKAQTCEQANGFGGELVGYLLHHPHATTFFEVKPGHTRVWEIVIERGRLPLKARNC